MVLRRYVSEGFHVVTRVSNDPVEVLRPPRGRDTSYRPLAAATVLIDLGFDPEKAKVRFASATEDNSHFGRFGLGAHLSNIRRLA